jgi:hypothetical protein
VRPQDSHCYEGSISRGPRSWTRLGAYEVLTLIGSGGMGEVSGESQGGLVLFRRTVRTTNYGQQARFLTELWAHEAEAWDWLNRVVYLPKSP